MLRDDEGDYCLQCGFRPNPDDWEPMPRLTRKEPRHGGARWPKGKSARPRKQ